MDGESSLDVPVKSPSGRANFFCLGQVKNAKTQIIMKLTTGISITRDHHPEYPAFLAMGAKMNSGIAIIINISSSDQIEMPPKPILVTLYWLNVPFDDSENQGAN